MAAGRIVASKYCLLYEVGRGGMGSVWVAEHLMLRSQVAVKLIDSELAGTLDVVKRFEREARAAASCVARTSCRSSTSSRWRMPVPGDGVSGGESPSAAAPRRAAVTG